MNEQHPVMSARDKLVTRPEEALPNVEALSAVTNIGLPACALAYTPVAGLFRTTESPSTSPMPVVTKLAGANVATFSPS